MRITVLSFILLVAGAAVTTGAGPGVPEATRVDDFRLADHLGRSHRLYRYEDAKGIVLFYAGNGCPIVRQSVPELKRLRDAYASRGIVFLLINANPQDDRESIAEEAREYGIDLPILRDDAQAVSRLLGATRTAEAILIDTDGWKIAYRGAIDDRFDYGTAKPEPKQRWLEPAIEALLSGTEIRPAKTEAKGCLIRIEPAPAAVSYARDVAPVLEAKCVRCHRDDGVAPFAFEDYGDASGWAPMMREVILTRRMPPWHADPAFGRFANDRSLTAAEQRALVAWVEAGAPRGEGDDPLAKNERGKPAEWPLGPPDLVVSLQEDIEIPAQGAFDYRYFRVPSGFTEDTWIRATDVQPGNRRAVHHALVFLEYPPELRDLQRDMQGGLEGFFAGYVPGQAPVPFPEGTGKFVPKGSNFVFQMHYTATGKPETDRTRLALYVAKERPKFELETLAAHQEDFLIPAGAPDHTVSAQLHVPHDAILWSLTPHMHYRGSWFEYEAQYPDGRKELLLSVPNYDFNWQSLYRFAEPRPLPGGTRIVCRGGFDNSPRNPANPDPAKAVTFGEQTWDEMFIGYMELSRVEPAPAEQSGSN